MLLREALDDLGDFFPTSMLLCSYDSLEMSSTTQVPQFSGVTQCLV